MNWFDIFLLIVFGLHVLNGFSRGLIKQLFDIFSFIVVIILSFWGSRFFSEALAEYIDPENIISHHELIENLGLEVALEHAPQLIAGIITFLVLFIIFSIVFRLLSGGFRWINRIPVIGFFNRFAGIILGAIIGVIFIYIIVALVSIIPLQFFMDALEESEIVFFTEHYLVTIVETIKEFAVDFYLNMNS
ncbi:MAG: CvpA family protein [Bacillota bacterium]